MWKRVLLALAALWAFASPALALTPGQKVVLLQAVLQPALSLDFVHGAYRENGAVYASPSSLPGWTNSGGASPNGVVEDNGAGVLATYASGSLRIIPNKGLSVWQASTNLFLNNATCATQSVSTSAGSYTVSMYGAGSITLSGSASGTLTGAGAGARSSLTVTATSGTLTLTVSGSATYCQVENLAFASPAIITTSASATRGADVASLPVTIGASGAVLAKYISPPIVVNAPAREYLWNVSDSGNGRLSMRAGDANAGAEPSFVIGDGVSNATLTPVTTSSSNVLTKAAAAWGGGNALLSVNGQSPVTAAKNLSATLYGTQTLVLGSGGSLNQLNGYIQAVQLYPVALPPAKLQALTH